ncbi:hypothetical protein HQ325_12390 [Rhodococcus sp. BP-349]|uniref:ArnT family glycosyltransferase n=1 Tax=unclassified Rhodococcus (in: high G+C Gram-positive bacteria) TaxID=192944 RepID=UPI001C9B91D1|nr:MULTISPECIES: hypothetical protein [unclassified Rhodococcus (in: high G+C Gram-positive bacteria)]MBY6595307.1 hypothetical protein [Rhodococcus sp. BP-359]MBY6621333.1 hypothetical protein [Rhodococcus sp. BP-357]MBY6539473.1 hypothetical protein [Rhodococcus sp. BP-363]MBY6544199.1 hypothetical protein [Rhodococcus sp. BP-369]MBY6563429.1 hypothetical protein [Rhodococcus sp. BP-370]
MPRAVTAAFLLVAVALVAYALHMSRQPLRYVDEQQYLDIARSLADGSGFSIDGRPSAYRPPAWPLLLSIFVAVGVDGTVLILVSAVAMIAGAAVAGFLCARLAGSPHGYWASVAILLYPLDFYTAATLYPQALATLLILVLWVVVSAAGDRGVRALSWRVAAVVGLVMAALALSVPTMVFTAGLVGVWLVIQQRGNRVRFTAITLLFFVIPVALWAARNDDVLGAPVLFSTTSGENLVIGNNSSATGSSGVDIVYPPEAIPPDDLTEVERDSYFRDAATDWILAHPSEAFGLYLDKVVNYFAPYNEPTTAARGSDAQKWVATIAFGAIVIGTVTRIALRRRVPLAPSEWVFLGIFVANAPFMALFFTRTRFRQPLDSILIIEAVVALVALGSLAWSARDRSTADERVTA